MTPSISRAVHYVSYGTPGGEYPSVCRAAVVAEVGAWGNVKNSPVIESGGVKTRVLTQEFFPDAVTLVVLNPSGIFFNAVCEHDEDKAPGTWHWPERVEE